MTKVEECAGLVKTIKAGKDAEVLLSQTSKEWNQDDLDELYFNVIFTWRNMIRHTVDTVRKKELGRVNTKHLFWIAATVIYAPSVFSECDIPNGFRQALRDASDCHSESNISTVIRNAIYTENSVPQGKLITYWHNNIVNLFKRMEVYRGK